MAHITDPPVPSGTYVQAGSPNKNTLATAGTLLFGTNVTGDTQDRFTVGADGKLSWGPGTGATDTTLTRSAAGVAQFNGSLGLGVTTPSNAAGGTPVLQVQGGTAPGISLVQDASGGHTARTWQWFVLNAGPLALYDATAPAYRMLFDTAGALQCQFKVKAGTPVDGDFTITPADGTLAVDSTANKLWVRVGGVWKGVVVA